MLRESSERTAGGRGLRASSERTAGGGCRIAVSRWSLRRTTEREVILWEIQKISMISGSSVGELPG